MFWYNLLRSGEGDYRTRHAACPVLVGCKWGKWLGGLSLGSWGQPETLSGEIPAALFSQCQDCLPF